MTGSSQVLSGRVAVVTGASRGVGRGIAIGLSHAGATVYATGRSVAGAALDPDIVRVPCDHQTIVRFPTCSRASNPSKAGSMCW